jgi:predicted GNAT family N-acyltransferase
MTRIRHPESPKEIAARDLLLQTALRPFPTHYPIAREYPTVLSSQDVRFSWCLYGDTQQLVAHANLWPRVLLDHATGFSMKVGLIGNVATDSTLRGQGHMGHLLEQLGEKAKQDGLHALILWSDLTEFYQKRGFSSCGLEKRFIFHVPSLQKKLRSTSHLPKFGLVTKKNLSVSRLGPSRFPVRTTLSRDMPTWASLMETAGLSIFAPNPKKISPLDKITPFLAIGKGHDLIHVVHEWGADSPETLLSGILAAGEHLGFEELMLLSPHDLPSHWEETLNSLAHNMEIHPMALARVLEDTPEAKPLLARAFIWGLDSI